MPRGRSKVVEYDPVSSESDDDLMVDDDDSFDDDDEDDDEESKEQIRSKTYQTYLPQLQKFIQDSYDSIKPDLQTDRQERSCSICPTLQWFKGWKALLAHAQTFTKKKKYQHRGYGDALKEALQVDKQPAVVLNLHDAGKDHRIVWPPVLIVDVIDRKGDPSQIIKDVLSKEGHSVAEMKIIQISSYCAFVVFKPEALCYSEANEIAKESKRWRRHIDASLAEPSDMKHFDDDRKLVDWSDESYYEKVRMALKKDKEEHNKSHAELRNVELKMETLTEDEERFKERQHHLQQLTEAKKSEIEFCKKRGLEMREKYNRKLLNLASDFQKEMRIFEARSNANLKRLRDDFERAKAQFEEEQAARRNEIENLKKSIEVLTEDNKQQEAQKAMNTELEIMEKKRKFMSHMAKVEADFNKRSREEELSLQETQHREYMQLLEKHEEEKEKLFKEWLHKHETLKNEGEEAKTTKDQVEKEEEAHECGICWDPIDENNRALFAPCGHAKLCIGCARDVYKEHGTCPFCRQKITRAPMVLQKIYM